MDMSSKAPHLGGDPEAVYVDKQEWDELRAENGQLREAQTALLEQNERFAVVIGELRSAIDKHNDECRECPVIES